MIVTTDWLFSLFPFSNVVLDGIDLNIENSSKTGHDGYPKFVEVLHKLMRTDTSKSYYITASPKCTFPDPNIGNTLQQVGYLFDELHIQYFNGDCYFGSSNFEENILKWVTFVRNIAKTHNDSALNSILIGLPAHKNMSSDEKYYQKPEDVATLIKVTLHKKWSFSSRISLVNVKKSEDLLKKFPEEILNGKLHFLCSVRSQFWKMCGKSISKQLNDGSTQWHI